MRYRLSGRTTWLVSFSLLLLAVLVALPWGVVRSADHRDSPLSSLDPSADINDVYVFVNPLDSTKVIFAMTVNGFAVPAVRSSLLIRTATSSTSSRSTRRATARKTWSSRPPSTASSPTGIRAARRPRRAVLQRHRAGQAVERRRSQSPAPPGPGRQRVHQHRPQQRRDPRLGRPGRRSVRGRHRPAQPDPRQRPGRLPRRGGFPAGARCAGVPFGRTEPVGSTASVGSTPRRWSSRSRNRC